MRDLQSLRVGGVLAVFTAFLLGLVAAGIWVQSNARWAAHLNDARFAGAVLYDSLASGRAPPSGMSVSTLAPRDQQQAERGRFEAIADVPRPPIVTNFSIRPSLSGGRSSAPLVLAAISPDLRYPLASVSSRPDQTPAETMGSFAQLLATYCSNPVLIAKLGEAPWVRITGAGIWDCAAAPSDFRLLAGVLALLAIGMLFTLVLNTSARFADFAQMLRDRKRIGGPDVYETGGVQELRDIVSAVNTYLAIERDMLAERAAVLSGVSHDLGTPATRLKLRTALIQDNELRAKLESDIDSMTGIIESVLTYTRAELDAEAPRKISLTSLIESVVADYQDTGRPVEFQIGEKLSVRGGQSLFMSRRGSGTLPQDDKVIVFARPVALGRALSNLIENALKYGRRAKVSLERDADTAIITVEDEGTNVSAEKIATLVAPFKRGDNTQMIKGHGLGLTIVSTVANLHGGSLTFEPGAKGLLARLTILRQ